MTVSPQYVADHYDEVSSAVENGEVVEIAAPQKAPLRLVSSLRSTLKLEGQRVLGAGKAFAQLPGEEDLERIDREWKREMDEKVIGCPAE